MTDNERLGIIWEFVKTKLSKVDAAIEREHTNEDYSIPHRPDEEYNWGAREAFKEVLDFMDDLMD